LLAPAPGKPSRRVLLAALAAGVVAIPVAALALLGHDKPAAFAAQPPAAQAVPAASTADTTALALKPAPSQTPEPTPAPDPAPDPAPSAARHAQQQRPVTRPHPATGPASTSVAKTAATDDRY
jgi:outer membrane biosynthesis protein TonB